MSALAQPAATLALTIVVEWLVYLAALRGSPPQLALYALLLNALTQPPANLLYGRSGHFWAIEAGVWLVEGALLCAVASLRPARALLVAALANGASAARRRAGEWRERGGGAAALLSGDFRRGTLPGDA